MSSPVIPLPEPSSVESPRSKGLWLLSGRTLLAVLLLVAVGCLVRIGIPAYRQAAAIRQIERLGGYASIHGRSEQSRLRLMVLSVLPGWVRE